jgi:hypothetical protein
MCKEETLLMVYDEVYLQYEADSSMEWTRYIHPTNWRGDYGEPLPEPEETMSKEEFIVKIESGELPMWEKAVTTLFRYLMKFETSK